MILSRKAGLLIGFAAIMVFFAISSCSLPFLQTKEKGSLFVSVHIPDSPASVIPSTVSGSVTDSLSRFVHPDTNTVVVTVSSADMTTVTKSSSVVTGNNTVTIELDNVPVGLNRLVKISLLGIDGSLLAEGSKTMDIITDKVNQASITAIPFGATVLEIGVPVKTVNSGGKSFVYSVNTVGSGAYVVRLALDGNQHSAPSVYDSNGIKVTITGSGTDIFTFPSTAVAMYYIVVTIPAGYAGPGTTVVNLPFVASKAITAFTIPALPASGIVTEASHTIALSVPFGTDVTSLSPAITHTGASISPLSGVPQNFLTSKTYTVTASDGTTQDYIVTVTVLPASANANLSSLTLSLGTLSPTFAQTTTSYTATVLSVDASITVAAAKADATASVSITPVQPSTLVVGSNTINITVTAQNGISKTYTVIVNRPTMAMINVPAGSFQRDGTVGNDSSVSAFSMSAKLVTRTQFLALLGTDPSNAGVSTGLSDPVQMVNWYHAIAFCNKLSLAEGLTPVYSVVGVPDFSSLIYSAIPVVYDANWDAATTNWSANGYRLPTEMEWLWAAMGATSDSANGYTGGFNATGYTKGYAGSSEALGAQSNIANYAWTSENSVSKTNPVGTKLPNELGLYDMTGNVWEWCWDKFSTYPAGAVSDYLGGVGTNRVTRGGSWANTTPGNCPLSVRNNSNTDLMANNNGFRIVRR